MLRIGSLRGLLAGVGVVNTQEAAALLSVAAAFDNRKPDPDAATAWAAALDGLRFVDCRDAIVAHYRTSSDWLMPQMVIAGVKRIRTKRIHEYGPIEPPVDLDPADTLAYTRWQRETLTAVGNGERLPEPRVVPIGTPMPPELAAKVERFGRLPDDVARAKGDPA